MLDRKHLWITQALFALSLLGCVTAAAADTAPAALSYQVIEKVEREPAFTQGLEFYRNDLIHSTGLVGQSFVERRSHPKAFMSKQLWRIQLPAPIFGEGSSVFADELYVLSWRQGIGWRLDPNTGKQLGEFRYRGQGWGLTHNGEHLIRSDGSTQLFFHQPGDFSLSKTLQVSRRGKPVERLNELEFAEGYIWANIWQTNTIVAINPATGQVEAELDMAALGKDEPTRNRDNVLNGIAFDPATGHYWLTGKRWHHWYRVAIELPVSKAKQ